MRLVFFRRAMHLHMWHDRHAHRQILVSKWAPRWRGEEQRKEEKAAGLFLSQISLPNDGTPDSDEDSNDKNILMPSTKKKLSVAF
jgi:hypothetical protein